MKIIPHRLTEDLTPFIKHMWIIEEGGASNVSIRSFPVGYAFINVIDGQSFRIDRAGQSGFYRSYLAGPQSKHYQLEMGFINRALTIQLQPFALADIFDMPASDFADQIVSLSDIDRDLAHQLEERVSSTKDSSQVMDAVANILRKTIAHQSQEARLEAALGFIMKSGGNLKISDLAYQVNLSQRRLQQLFQYHFGLSPKKYGNVIKMQYHTYQLLQGIGLDTIVPDGYYDQAHFIHELKKQTGMLPKEFYNYISDNDRCGAYINSSIYNK